MSTEISLETEPEVEVSELKMAAAYGIEGLKRCTETKEYDEWLDLFDVVLEELNKPLQRGEGSFPVKQAVLPDEKERQNVVEGFEEISEIAEEVKQREIDARQEMDQELNQKIERAEEVYDELESFAANP